MVHGTVNAIFKAGGSDKMSGRAMINGLPRPAADGGIDLAGRVAGGPSRLSDVPGEGLFG